MVIDISAVSSAIPEETVLSGLPTVRRVTADEVAAAMAASGRSLVVLDDDPTGTQSVADVPVLTAWGVDDIRWGFQQGSGVFYILTNTRSLGPLDMAARNREVVASLVEAAKSEKTDFVVASRSDSTLRGHFPLETDVISDALVANGRPPVDGTLVVPAYIDAGRVTVASVHWMRVPEGLLPVGLSEFAQDATFGYRSSDLRDYVAEKTAGRWAAADVVSITLPLLREGGPEAVADVLQGLRGGQPAVADAVNDDDLRLLALGVMSAEARGSTLLYRVGPSYVRARAGLVARPPLSPAEIGAIRSRADHPGGHGLIVVGSHVPRTTRQLDALLSTGAVERVDLDVTEILDPHLRREAIARATAAVSSSLRHSDVALCTSRQLVRGDSPDASLGIARSISSALVEVTRAAGELRSPGWVVAKGGITSSDIATEALGIRRAWARGTLLPGIVSLWEPVVGTVPGAPYIVFAGNVGDDRALVDAVSHLNASA